MFDNGYGNFMLTTAAKKFPPYVYGTSAGACLVHRISGINLHWSLDLRGRRVFSHYSINCECAQTFLQRKSQMCVVPNVDAIDCGRCYKLGPIFRKHSDYDKRKEAHKKLGCVVEATA